MSPQPLQPEPPDDGIPGQLIALSDQAKAGAEAAQKMVADAQAAGVPGLSLALTEIQTRIQVIIEALFGIGTADALNYEIACHETFLRNVQSLMEQGQAAAEERARIERMTKLTEGVTVRADMPK